MGVYGVCMYGALEADIVASVIDAGRAQTSGIRVEINLYIYSGSYFCGHSSAEQRHVVH